MTIRDSLASLGKYRPFFNFTLAIFIGISIIIWPRYEPATANRCFALLVFVIIMWIGNGVAPFVTSLSIPILAVTLKVMLDGKDGSLLSASQAGSKLLSAMLGPTIPVLLASFSIAACYKHYDIPFIKRNSVLEKISNQSLLFVLVIMSVTLALCLIVDNISATMIGFSFLNGRFRGRNIDNRLSKALLMGLAVSGNLGGSLTPVSSAQAVFSFALIQKSLNITWLDWIYTSIPCTMLSMIIGWIIIVLVYDIRHVKVESPPSIEDAEPNLEQPNQATPTWKLALILFTTFMTILLWATSRLTISFFGGMGIIAFIPIVILYGSGILTGQELALIPWDIILLVMGALALVEASQSSGLPMAITENFKKLLLGLNVWTQIAVINFIIFISSTFKSHTIAGLVFIPVVLSYINVAGLSPGEGQAMFILAVLTTSIGMAFPFSGIVNQILLGISDGDGNRIIDFTDYLKIGLPVSLVAYLTIISLGFYLL